MSGKYIFFILNINLGFSKFPTDVCSPYAEHFLSFIPNILYPLVQLFLFNNNKTMEQRYLTKCSEWKREMFSARRAKVHWKFATFQNKAQNKIKNIFQTFTEVKGTFPFKKIQSIQLITDILILKEN
jgi:hypothetical protein